MIITYKRCLKFTTSLARDLPLYEMAQSLTKQSRHCCHTHLDGSNYLCRIQQKGVINELLEITKTIGN